MKKRSLVAWLAMLAILVFAIIVGEMLSKRQPIEQVADRSEGTSLSTETEAPSVSSPVAATPQDSMGSRPRRDPLTPVPPADEEGQAEEGMITISGRVIALDVEGVEHSLENGSFVPHVFEDVRGDGWRPGVAHRDDQHGAAVVVSGGQFQLATEPGKKLQLCDLLLGGKRALPTSDYYLESSQDRACDVLARWLSSPRLVVRDEETLELLSPVDIVKSGGRRHYLDEHPGLVQDVDFIYREEPTPVLLDPGLFLNLHWLKQFSRVVWVRSPGYAWRRVTLRFNEFYEAEVLLGPPAGLVVSVVAPPEVFMLAEQGARLAKRGAGMEPVIRLRTDLDPSFHGAEYFEELLGEDGPEKISLRNRSSLMALLGRLRENEQLEGNVLMELPLASEEKLVTDLPAKRTTVSIELGYDDDRQVLVWTSVELVAGEQAHVQLVLDQLPAYEEPVGVRGTLHLPSEWATRGVRLELVAKDSAGSMANPRTAIPLSRMRSVRSPEEGLYRWSAGKLVPGRYMAIVSSLQFSQEVIVPPEGVDDVHIEVGAPATVTIKVVDSGTGLAVPIEALHWTGSQSDAAESETFGIAKEGPDSETYSLVAPAGRIELFCWSGASYYFYHEVHDVSPGEGELTLGLVRSCGVKITASGGASSPRGFALGNYVHVESSDGEPGASTFQLFEDEDGNLLVQFSSPGQHVISFDAIEGFSTLEQLTVDVREGEFLERAVVLQRTR